MPQALYNSDLLVAEKTRVRDWLFEHAFPFWAARSVSPEGVFFERLDLDGNGILGQDSRVRVQARQTYSFALACRMGWNRGEAIELSKFGVNVLLNQCRRSDGLYGTTIEPGRGLKNDTAELYDNAFALLAFSTVLGAYQDRIAMRAGMQLIDQINSLMKADDGAWGYKERLPAPARREQNPHMHLCEALLAWFESTEDAHALTLAEEIAKTVMAQFFDVELGLLLELDKNSSSNRFEVGHMYEWVWLLGKLDRLLGRNLRLSAYELYDGAEALAKRFEFLPLSQDLTGRPINPDQRTWIRTEALKAHIAIHRASNSEVTAARVSAELNALFEHHLERDCPLGAWMDVRDQYGNPRSKDITVATGYHVFLAMDEVMNLLESLRHKGEVPRLGPR